MSILDTLKSWFGAKTEVINETPVVATEPMVQAPIVEETIPETVVEEAAVEEVLPEAAPKTDDTIMGDNQ